MRVQTIGVVALLLSIVAVPARAQADLDQVDIAFAGVVAADSLPGGIVVVRDGQRISRYTAGYSNIDTRSGFPQNSHVRAASITKTFVAATVLELVAEGSVDLDAPIERYLPGRVRGQGIDGNAITVRQLLRQQSGLPEYFAENAALPVDPVTSDQLLDDALTKPALFAPGAEMKYTNTNYILAGLLIESVAGRPAQEEITRRIVVPLGLSETYFPAPADTGLRAPFAHGYIDAMGQLEDVTEFNASVAGIAGELISTNEDMAAFIDALIGGRIIPPPQLAEMMQTVDWTDTDYRWGAAYGLGLASIDTSCGVTVWTVSGDIPGYSNAIAKSVGGPAASVTFNEFRQWDSVAVDPRRIVLEALYCPPRVTQ